MDKPNHLAIWSVAFAAASLGVWLTWVSYTWLGMRFRAPDWVLANERVFFTLELVALMVGTAVTAYQSGAFKPQNNEEDLTAE